MAVPYTFALATSPIPLSQLDADFAYFANAFNVSGANVTLTGQLNLTNASDYNVYASGAGGNYFAGKVGIGVVPVAGRSLTVGANLTGNVNSRGAVSTGTILSDVTSQAFYYATIAQTQAASFTLGNLTHYYANQSTIGAGSTVGAQYGFFAESTLIGGANNYGFYGNIASGSGRYNFYAGGTAANYFAGNVGIGGIVPTTYLTLNAAGQVEGIAGVAGSTYLWGLTRNNVNGVAIDSYGSTTFITNSLTGSKTGTERGSVSGAGVWSLGAAAGSESLRVNPVASAVNYLGVYGASTGNAVNIRADGGNTNIGMLYDAKGTFGHTFRTNVYGGAPVQFAISNTTSAVNYLQVTGQGAGESPNMSAQGSNADININFIPKGTGGVAAYSAGQSVAAISTTTLGGSVSIFDTNGVAGSGGSVVFGAANGTWRFAAIKSYATNGASNTQGDLYFLTRRAATDATLTSALTIASTGTISLGSVQGSESLRVTPITSAVNFWDVRGAAANNDVAMYAVGSSANIGALFVNKGAGYTYFYANGGNQLVIAPTLNAVNYLQVTGNVTAGNPSITAQGFDPNIGLNFSSKGISGNLFYTNGLSNLQFVVAHAAGAVDYLTVQGNSAGFPIMSAQGASANITIVYAAKGTGGHSFTTNASFNNQFRVADTPSAVNYLQATGSSGTTPTLSAQGSGADVSIALFAKGAGSVFPRSASTTPFYVENPSYGAAFAVTQSGGTTTNANYVQVSATATAGSPTISVVGSDANIDITVAPKGTGNVRFGTLTASSDVAITGYITIKDSGGTIRKLAVIT